MDSPSLNYEFRKIEFPLDKEVLKSGRMLFAPEIQDALSAFEKEPKFAVPMSHPDYQTEQIELKDGRAITFWRSLRVNKVELRLNGVCILDGDLFTPSRVGQRLFTRNHQNLMYLDLNELENAVEFKPSMLKVVCSIDNFVSSFPSIERKNNKVWWNDSETLFREGEVMLKYRNAGMSMNEAVILEDHYLAIFRNYPNQETKCKKISIHLHLLKNKKKLFQAMIEIPRLLSFFFQGMVPLTGSQKLLVCYSNLALYLWIVTRSGRSYCQQVSLLEDDALNKERVLYQVVSVPSKTRLALFTKHAILQNFNV